MLKKKYIGKDAALQKMRYYCAYQERCHSEVKEKLYQLGLFKTDVEELISTLVELDYLNEQRFAEQFAGGKFRIKQWGRVKIKHALAQKRVSTYCITKGLTAIDETEYLVQLKKLAEKKWASLKGEQYLNRQAKTQAYLMQKGFEGNLVSGVIAELRGKGAD